MSYCILHKDEHNACDQEALYCHNHAARVGNAELREENTALKAALEEAKKDIVSYVKWYPSEDRLDEYLTEKYGDK